MIIKKLVTAIEVYDVSGIAVEKVDGLVDTEPFEVRNAYSRCIRVYTTGSDELELVLYADADTKLELKESDWLTPKVYKGKSMHELEMEEKE